MMQPLGVPMCAANALSPYTALKAHCYLCTASVLSLNLMSAECNPADFVYTVQFSSVIMFAVHYFNVT